MVRRLLLFVFTFLCLVVSGGCRAEAPARAEAEAEASAFERALMTAFDEQMATLRAAADTISHTFSEIDNLLTAQELRLRRFRSAEHLASARALGVGRVAGQDAVDRLVAQDRLVQLPDTTPYYYVQELDYSVPYVTPDMAALLQRIGERFHEQLAAQGLPRYRYCISSVLRTAENQQDLRKINPNAARGVSTHEFGTTVDIVYHKYSYLARPEEALPGTDYAFLDERLEPIRVLTYEGLGMRYWQELQGILGRVLIELQEEGLVKVTLEREQPVFHITVAQPLAGA